MSSSQANQGFLRVLWVLLIPIYVSAGTVVGIESLLKKMEAAYKDVKDYRAKVEVRTYSKNGSFETETFLYSFKKPKRIRFDFESPYPGMVLVYPDKDGKVVIRPSGLARFLKLRVAPDNSLLKVPSGQRIDQTDLGLLIRNIAHSLADGRRGPIEAGEEDGYIEIRVLADNPFRKGVITLYHFAIDRRLWLPVKVEESTSDSQLERTVIFQNLRINIGIPDSLFRLDGG